MRARDSFKGSQRVRFAFADERAVPFAHLRIEFLELGNVRLDNDLDQATRELRIVYMRRIVAVAEHLQPYLLVHAVVVPVGSLDDLTRGPHVRNAVALVPQKLLHELPAQLKLKGKLRDDATLDELVFEILAT